jgi:hypothetical protein
LKACSENERKALDELFWVRIESLKEHFDLIGLRGFEYE